MNTLRFIFSILSALVIIPSSVVLADAAKDQKKSIEIKALLNQMSRSLPMKMSEHQTLMKISLRGNVIESEVLINGLDLNTISTKRFRAASKLESTLLACSNINLYNLVFANGYKKRSIFFSSDRELYSFLVEKKDCTPFRDPDPNVLAKHFVRLKRQTLPWAWDQHATVVGVKKRGKVIEYQIKIDDRKIATDRKTLIRDLSQNVQKTGCIAPAATTLFQDNFSFDYVYLDPNNVELGSTRINKERCGEQALNFKSIRKKFGVIEDVSKFYLGKGIQAQKAKKYSEAVKWYRLGANEGDRLSQNQLGSMYQTGRGVKKNKSEAMHWYRKSARQGLKEAQHNLAVLLYFDERKAVEAAKMWESAAIQNHLDAQYYIGYLYFKGDGVAKDLSKAAGWWEKGAKAGDKKAQFNFGLLHVLGGGVEKNKIKGRMWWEISVLNGSKHAKAKLDKLEQTMSNSDIKKAKQKAKHCLKTNYNDCD